MPSLVFDSDENRPPAVLANATTERRKGVGEDRSCLNSRVFPSGRQSISVRSIARQITLKCPEAREVPSSVPSMQNPVVSRGVLTAVPTLDTPVHI